MKLSFSTRWVLCWTLFVLAILILVVGVFSFSSDWRQGLGGALMGLGIGVPTAWWLRHASRAAHVRRMKLMACLGVILITGGAFLVPWKQSGEGRAAAVGSFQEKNSKSSTGESPPPTSSSVVSTAQKQPAEALSLERTPAIETSESTVTVTEVETLVPPQETITAVETVIQPPATVYRGPVVPSPPQTGPSDADGVATQPEQFENAPVEPATPTEITSVAPPEGGNAQPQYQTTEEPQTQGD